MNVFQIHPPPLEHALEKQQVIIFEKQMKTRIHLVLQVQLWTAVQNRVIYRICRHRFYSTYQYDRAFCTVVKR